MKTVTSVEKVMTTIIWRKRSCFMLISVHHGLMGKFEQGMRDAKENQPLFFDYLIRSCS